MQIRRDADYIEEIQDGLVHLILTNTSAPTLDYLCNALKQVRVASASKQGKWLLGSERVPMVIEDCDE